MHWNARSLVQSHSLSLYFVCEFVSLSKPCSWKAWENLLCSKCEYIYKRFWTSHKHIISFNPFDARAKKKQEERTTQTICVGICCGKHHHWNIFYNLNLKFWVRCEKEMRANECSNNEHLYCQIGFVPIFIAPEKKCNYFGFGKTDFMFQIIVWIV